MIQQQDQRATSIALDVHPYVQYGYQTRETELGLEATFTIKSGQSLGTALDAACESYDTHASKRQKEEFDRLVSGGDLIRDHLLRVVAKKDTTYTLTILKDAAKKKRRDVMNRAGKILIAEDMIATERAVITVAAALHIDRSVAEGILVVPETMRGREDADLLGKNIVRARSGSLLLTSDGLSPNYVSDDYSDYYIVAAASPSPDERSFFKLRFPFSR